MNVQRPGTRFHWQITAPFLVVVALLAALGLSSVHILSAVRAYVGGESLWSKGQKDAVYQLASYARSHDARHFQAFVDAIAIPQGDQRARNELERRTPDLAVARLGFIAGGNHPEDIDGMVWLFRGFRQVSFMADAIAVWAEADQQIAELNALADQLHARVLAGDTTSTQWHALVNRITPLNETLTELEQRFSATMGEASRSAQRVVQTATLFLAVVLAAVALGLSSALLHRQGRAEKALRAGEERFRLLWDTAPDAIVMLDGKMQIQYANAAVQDLFGHAPSAVIGKSLAMLQPERLREAHLRGMERYLRTRQKTLNWRSTKVTGLHRDGREIPLEIAFSHVEINGEPQFAGFLRDVSARQQAEQALRTSEERLQRAVDASGLALWDFDVESGNVYLSESWSQMLGGPRESMQTSFAALADRVPEAERASLYAALVDALKDPNAHYRVEHRVRTIGGEWIWNLSEGRVVERGEDGRALRMVGTNRDITERKAADMTRVALEAQLRESQKMEAIGTLAGGIAHDFNNILGAILGNLALVQQDIGAGHAAALSLDQINKTALRARSLVQQILAFGRHQPQKLMNRPLRPLVEESLAMMRSTLPAAAKLDSVLPSGPLHVLADATQIQQVLINLCTNAWHALRGQPGTIEVGLEPVEFVDASAPKPAGLPLGSYAHVWVRDSGCGMDALTQARIFEPFFTTKPIGQGTGLGLSVVHGIVAAHHGTITVDSAVGHGSTFRIYLPRVDPKEGEPTSAWGTLEPVQAQGDGQHVLYVDDDDVMSLLVERLLSRLGYRVTCHADPRQALAVLRAQPREFELVVSDFNMPDYSGLDLAREIATLLPDLPVVISSGFLTDLQRAEMLDAGVVAVIQKERTIEELGPLIHRVLHRQLV